MHRFGMCHNDQGGKAFRKRSKQSLTGFIMRSNSETIDVKAAALLIILCASWGLQQITIKIAVESISPALQGGIRSIGAAVLLSMWMAARGEKIILDDGTFRWGLAVGLLFSAEFLLIYWGLEFTSASRSVLFLYTMPFFTAVGAHWLIHGESLGKVQIAGLCCAFLGIVIAFSDSMGQRQHSMIIGDLMLLVAAVFWAAATILVKASPLAGIRASCVLLYQLVVSAIVLPVGAVLLGQAEITHATPLIWGCLAYQTIWVAFITYLAWFWLIRNYPASKLSAFLFLTPLFGVMESVLLIGDQVSYRLAAALALVCIGIYSVNRYGGRSRAESVTLPSPVDEP
jgi:drug/metabolite transporter (DMT)-like permease